MNRLDKVVVFHPLRPEQLEKILEIELGMVQQRVLDAGRGQFLFRVTPEARGFLLREGTDMKYGARHLKRAIERNIVYPLANLSATDQARLGDLLRIDWKPNGTLSFSARRKASSSQPCPAGGSRKSREPSRESARKRMRTRRPPGPSPQLRAKFPVPSIRTRRP